MRKLHNKKAQIQTQVFIYILSMIIVGLVLLYGYNAVRGFRDRQETVSLIETENMIKNSIKAMSSEFDSIRKQELFLPGGIELICFVDRELVGTVPAEEACKYGLTPIPLKNHLDPKVSASWTILKDAIADGTGNIFLIPDGTVNYLVGNIQVADDKCICIEKTGSQAIYRMRGLGNGVEVELWRSRT